MGIKEFYEKKYKVLLIIPLALLLLAFIQIGTQFVTTGDFVNRGISLKGGSSITLEDTSLDIVAIENNLAQQFPEAQISVRSLGSAGSVAAYVIDSAFQTEEEIARVTQALEQQFGVMEYGVEIVGSSLGESFFRQTSIALLLAFVLMGIVVFAYFRTLAPSAAVIVAAFSDIVVTLAIFNLSGIKLSSAGIAAFLMLIGYSVDTDILLSSRMLKRTHLSVMQRVYSAMKTGLTMSFTTIAVVLITLIFVQSDIIKQIMVILLIGLLVDLIMTWLQNVAILRMYVAKKKL